MFTRLMTILKKHPDGIKEYDLLKQLELEHSESTGNSGFDELRSTYDLFQRHFLLFHSLYRLKDALLRHQCYCLDIHCLNIRLGPYYNPHTTLPALYDPLRDYYLNLNHLHYTSKDDVNDLIQQFWQRYKNQANYNDNKHSALKQLGLDLTANKLTIKKRFNQLRSQHHPDHGGNPEHFQQIEQAGKTLLNIYK
ncbi:DNA-J related protein [Piscirickettsia salmonis]|nr:DNA-J related domain-containing protein [Piscirickettsia salmonis]QGP54189.1 DNA-J related protein [Piscirickettsia salmonis]QGP59915.1 DNA-J related protein [Piscirickettsia salmonis]QGP63766.1 DNA-J related protein [Piscirickettsia salmonis]